MKRIRISIIERRDNAETEARSVIESTAGVCAEYPDWPEWLRSVRGRSAHERLQSYPD